ncbi:uncharacterized protein N7511_003882 [Penicillium nucicola]|uniref:uncharacterized protein n=1 Tax=Penicillium nucicola TaxID=1850975 RepID=UPI002544F305|nr:uncharacterized protein N7511_003882 [Penicillium nucicola]KAJ5766266.1 hypothetical protein N7511_003882 [Penicillium nucicola]
MPLVQYSDSESEPESESRELPPCKKPRHDPTPGPSLPPLPAAFHDLYASSTRVSVQDDPSLHGGRKRAIPHVEGNWPTHLYLEWYPAKEELSLLAELVAHAETSLNQNAPTVHSLLHSDLHAQLPLHISLSRPVVLRTEQRAPFTELLQKAIHDSHISPFEVLPDSLGWASNYDKTRWFLVLRVKKPAHDCLNALLNLSNSALARFDQPPLYAVSSHMRNLKHALPRGENGASLSEDYSDCFHISLAWSLSGPSESDRQRVASIDLKALQARTIAFDSVKAKMGNNVDDLQAFHAKHFPGKPQPILPPGNDQLAEDDLGYYPDGVKRTLTDEQIRIFRHSEIHALLRQKQLQIENAEYEARMAPSGDSPPDVKSPTEETQAAFHSPGSQTQPLGRKPPKKRVAEDMDAEPLDYGSDQPPVKRPTEPRVPYQGRRIISYDD